MDRLFERMFGPFVTVPYSPGVRGSGSSVPFDITEKESAYEFVADAPGFTGDDIKVELHEGNVLVVTGEKQQKEEQAKKDKHSGENKVWRQERAYSSFSRAFTLPEDAKGDGITARMEHGVLTVVVPKAPPAPKSSPKRVQVISKL